MKKVFYLLFACYFIALTLSPCDCDHHANNATQETYSHNHSQKKSNNRASSDKVCHPFCGCTYYTSYIASNSYVPTRDKISIYEIDESIYLDTILPLMVFPIWQPPQQMG